MVYKNNIRLKKHPKSEVYTQSEHLECCITTDETVLHLFVVYRPPPSSTNQLKHCRFFEEWTCFLQKCTKIQSDIVILGDINIHFDEDSDHNTCKINDLLFQYGFQQHVHEQTHALGHTLNVIITRQASTVVQNIRVLDPYIYSNANILVQDHFPVLAVLHLAKPECVHKSVHLPQLILESWDEIYCKTEGVSLGMCGPLDDLMDAYKGILSDLADKHAPLTAKTITLRPNSLWWTMEQENQEKP